MNTNIADCSGTPFTFHAEYSTASIQNRVPWAAIEGGVLMEQEIGHSEVCGSLKNQDPANFSLPGGQTFSDSKVFDTCMGGSEAKGHGGKGEGPCSGTICQNATTQGPTGPVACPVNDAATGALCEFADGYCFPKGARTVLINGQPAREVSAANQCNTNRFQNGDLDFEGLNYQPNGWPDGTASHPTAFQYVGPFDARGNPYPQIQFETNVAGSSSLCDVLTGAGCTAPPISANFYPFWSLSPSQSATAGSTAATSSTSSTSCVWNFGNVLPQTVQDFGGDAQYGAPDLSWFGGTLISAPMTNPQFSGRCAH
jgi:hypothetical protein